MYPRTNKFFLKSKIYAQDKLSANSNMRAITLQCVLTLGGRQNASQLAIAFFPLMTATMHRTADSQVGRTPLAQNTVSRQNTHVFLESHADVPHGHGAFYFPKYERGDNLNVQKLHR